MPLANHPYGWRCLAGTCRWCGRPFRGDRRQPTREGHFDTITCAALYGEGAARSEERRREERQRAQDERVKAGQTEEAK